MVHAPTMPRPSAAQIETHLATHDLRFLSSVIRTREGTIPDFAGVFADLCVVLGGFPPSQDELLEAYNDHHPGAHYGVRGADMFGLEARLRRMHPSFVRDRHLEAMLV